MGLKELEEALELGMDYSLREGYAWAEDKEHCEEYGRMLQVREICTFPAPPLSRSLFIYGFLNEALSLLVLK